MSDQSEKNIKRLLLKSVGVHKTVKKFTLCAAFHTFYDFSPYSLISHGESNIKKPLSKSEDFHKVENYPFLTHFTLFMIFGFNYVTRKKLFSIEQFEILSRDKLQEWK